MFINMLFQTLFIMLILFSMTIFFLSSKPLVIGSIVILQAMMISLSITWNSSISWFAYLIYLVYLGGILMTFSYIISLGYFKKEKKKSFLKILFVMIFLQILVILMKKYLLSTNKEFSIFQTKAEIMNFSILSKSLMSLTSFFIFYLLLVLAIVVLIVNIDKSMMRGME